MVRMCRGGSRFPTGSFAVGLLVLALALQNFVVQQHFHNLGGGSATMAAPLAAAPDRDTLPAQGPASDGDACPFCQVLHSGSAMVPSPAAPAPRQAIVTAAVRLAGAQTPRPRLVSLPPPRGPPAR